MRELASDGPPSEVKVDVTDHCDPDHRKLAVCSLICGLSCIGIMSLIYSVKAREARKRLRTEDCETTQVRVKEYTKKALKWGIVSIVAWICLIFISPLLVGLVSYILTFID